ncbi:hypothetical protein M0R01_01240 [bacterium]|nr:hypothetical protein [bacterium]
MNKELLKFFAGFFFAVVVLHIILVMSGIIPIAARGIVFDYSLWTTTLVLSLLLAILCSYLGWERKLANKISIGVMFFVLAVSVMSGSYFFQKDDFGFVNNKLLTASVVDQKKVGNNNQELKSQQLNDLAYAFSLGSEGNDEGKMVASDKENNVYIIGSFNGTINLDINGKAEKTSLGGIGEGEDIYLVKYDRYGKYVWGMSLGSIGNDKPTALKIENSSVYISGYFGGKADFDPSEKEFILDSGIGRDGFIAKYDSDGRYLWAQKIGNQENIPFEDNDMRFEQVSAIDIDENGNIYASGFFNDELSFIDKDEKEVKLIATKYSKNIFLAKYDKDGNILKAVSFAGGIINEPRSIVVSKGELFLSGIFNSKIAFNVNDPKKFSYTNGGQDLYLLKYDTDFNYSWSKKWGSLLDDNFNSMEIANDGTLIFSGSFIGSINFQGKILKSYGNQDAFILKIDRSGNVVFAKSFGGLGADSSYYAITDSVNNIYVVGYFSGIASFDNVSQQSVESFSSGDATDAFIAKYDNKGRLFWVRSLGGDVSLGDESQYFSGLAIDSLDYPIVTGTFAGNYNSEDINVSSNGAMDSIIIKYSPEGYKNN